MMLEVFLLCATGSAADLIRIGIEVLEEASVLVVALRILIRGIAVAYPIELLRRFGALGER